MFLIDIERLDAYNVNGYTNNIGDPQMDYMTIREAAEKWNLSVRRVQTICNESMVDGIVKFGREWAIPRDAEKPIDRRIKSGLYIKSQKADI